ncbi:MAG: ABC transporter ATPase [Flavobacteriales bacterium]
MQLPQHIISNISEQDRIWVYQADRFLTETEVEYAQKMLSAFTETWTAHNQQLKAKSFVVFNLFIILAVNENVHQASGCSIDKSVAIIKKLSEELNTDFLQRTTIALIEGEQIKLVALHNISSKPVSENSLFFNNLVTDGHSLKTQWIRQVGDSWLKRYLPVATT